MKDATIDALNLLVHSCVDGEGEYADCARLTRNIELQELFAYRAKAYREDAAALQAIVRDLGGRPDHRGSVLGTAHRSWVALRSTLSDNSDGAMLDECERGEDIVLRRYKAVLGESLPDAIRHTVLKQYEEARQTREQLRALRARFVLAPG